MSSPTLTGSQPTALVPDDPLDLVPPGARVAVAMSGGVDSSVAAARCVARGLDVVGVTLAMWPRDQEQDRDRGCCSVDAVDDARRVSAMLGIRHYAWNLEDEFNRAVIADFEAEYAAGKTPNPCLRCNERIKFGALLERAQAIGATHVATGHYAQLGRRGETCTLHRAVDSRKDQSYTLHRLDQRQLAAAVFPLGALADKATVRAEAQRLGLVTAAKPDSQELCFVQGTMSQELGRRLAGRFAPGDVVDRDGEVIGRHDGLPFYTVGQRSGLHVAPGQPDASPLYVIDVQPASNRLVAGPRASLDRRRIRATGFTWVGPRPQSGGLEILAQLRAHGGAHPGTIVAVDGVAVEVEFNPPVQQVAPGQALVAYDVATGLEVIGGGTVVSAS